MNLYTFFSESLNLGLALQGKQESPDVALGSVKGTAHRIPLAQGDWFYKKLDPVKWWRESLEIPPAVLSIKGYLSGVTSATLLELADGSFQLSPVISEYEEPTSEFYYDQNQEPILVRIVTKNRFRQYSNSHGSWTSLRGKPENLVIGKGIRVIEGQETGSWLDGLVKMYITDVILISPEQNTGEAATKLFVIWYHPVEGLILLTYDDFVAKEASEDGYEGDSHSLDFDDKEGWELDRKK